MAESENNWRGGWSHSGQAIDHAATEHDEMLHENEFLVMYG